MPEQTYSAFFAWAVVLVILAAATHVLRQRHHVPWPVVLTFALGALAVGLAGAITATSALVGHMPPDPAWMWAVIVLRALGSAVLLGVFMRLTLRPRWLIRRLDHWHDHV